MLPAALLALGLAGFTPAAVPHAPTFLPRTALAGLQLIYPNGGDTLVVGDGSVRWSSTSDILTVDLHLSLTGPGGPFVLLDRIPFNTGFTQVLFNALSNDAWLRIVGFTAAGDSLADTSRTAFRIVAPANPLLRYYVGDLVDAGVRLRWRFATRADLVREWLERAEQPGGAWEALLPWWSMAADTTIAVDTSAVAGRAYSYRISTYHDDTSIWSFTPYYVPIPAPRLALLTAAAFDDSVTLRWRFDSPPTVLASVVERTVDPFADWQPVAGVVRTEGAETVFTDGTTTAGGRYGYRVRVRVPGGIANTAAVFVSATPRVTSPVWSAARPNPAAGVVRFDVELTTSARVGVRILDPLGRQVARPFDGDLPRGRHTLSWDGGADPAVRPGIYFAELTTPALVVRRRIVVARLR